MGDRRSRSFHADGLNPVPTGAQSSRVRQAYRYAFDFDVRPQQIPRCTRYIGHDGPILGEQPVHQARFARIRWTGNHHVEAFAQGFAAVRLGSELLDVRLNGLQFLDRVRPGEKVDLLFREINRRFEVDAQIEHRPVDLRNPGREFAAEGSHRGPGGALRRAVDQVGDPFRLGKVDLVVEKCAFGELPGSSDPRAEFARPLEEPVHHHRAPVALEFDDVLARHGLRRRKVDDDAAIDCPAVGVREIRQLGLPGYGNAAHDAAQHVLKSATGQPHDAYAAAARRRRDRGDCFAGDGP